MSLDMQPTLEGPTITLRPLRADDREALRRAASDPLIWEQHPANRHQPDEFEAFFDEALAEGALVALTRQGEVIGTSRYHALDEQHSSVEIGWTFLVRSHWGGATNTEMKTLMVEHAFGAVQTIRFVVAPDNHRSQRAVEKLGARRVKVPATHPGVDFELSRNDWRRAHA